MSNGTMDYIKNSIEDGRIFFHPILMHFAARYAGTTYGLFASDFRVLVNCNIRCFEDFSLDAVGLISDPYLRGRDLFSRRQRAPMPATHRQVS